MSELKENRLPRPCYDDVYVRLVKRREEIEASQALRYQVFYEECGAMPTEDMARQRRDFDSYDEYTDHLVVLDPSHGVGIDRIVGTYRLLRQDVVEGNDLEFYTAQEFDIRPIYDCGAKLLELGRSCVLPEYRTRPVLQLLWQGIVDYVVEHDIELMFGCASFHGTDVNAIKEQLSYLYHYHLAESSLCPKVLDQYYVEMNILPKESLDVKKIFSSLPPLIKGYLRIGASIGHGAYIDKQFNTIDVCIVMPTFKITDRYRKHLQRKVDKSIPDTDFRKSDKNENV